MRIMILCLCFAWCTIIYNIANIGIVLRQLYNVYLNYWCIVQTIIHIDVAKNFDNTFCVLSMFGSANYFHIYLCECDNIY